MKRMSRVAVCAALAGLWAGPVLADAVADFYAGKTVRMVMPTTPGGSTALYGTTLGRHMSRHIPGTPTIIHEYRTGSGGLIAANYVYNAAQKDGTVITMLLSSTILSQLIQPKAAKFEIDKFAMIGRMADLPRALISWHTSGIKALDDARRTSVPLGASGRTSVTTIHPALLNLFIGTQFKIVTGYGGAGATYLALERGEISATTVAWDGLVGNRGDWLRQGKINVLARIGDRDFKEYNAAPSLIDLGRTAEEKAVLRLTLLPSEMGQAVSGPPGLPADRLAALRKAFDATMKDPTFLQEAKKRAMVIEPMTGDELLRLIKVGIDQPQSIIDRTRDLVATGAKATSQRKKDKK